jgi:hypothetical protein
MWVHERRFGIRFKEPLEETELRIHLPSLDEAEEVANSPELFETGRYRDRYRYELVAIRTAAHRIDEGEEDLFMQSLMWIE